LWSRHPRGQYQGGVRGGRLGGPTTTKAHAMKAREMKAHEISSDTFAEGASCTRAGRANEMQRLFPSRPSSSPALIRAQRDGHAPRGDPERAPDLYSLHERSGRAFRQT